MNNARADEIIRLTFYRHIDNILSVLGKNRDETEVAFDIGRYIGMMHKDLEHELQKEVNENEQSI